ncbi:MAG: M56 family metallopeptidase [Spirosomataceae bacterium]
MILIIYLLKASFILAFLTTFYGWLVKSETFLQVNRWLLWMNVMASLLLPIVPMPDFAWIPDAPAQIVSEVLPQTAPKITTENSISPTPAPIISKTKSALIGPSFSFWEWTMMIYGLVVGFLTIRFFVQLGTLWRLRQQGRLYKTQGGLYLIETDKIESPFSFFLWIFYNTSHHTEEEWTQILAHERIHAQQWHSLDIVSAELLKIVFWFNPFAWWHHRLVQETLEFITDRAVLSSGIEKKSYQYHLLRNILTVKQGGFAKNISTPYFNQSILKSRIAMMNRTKSNAWAVGKYGLFIALLWLCAAFTKPYRTVLAKEIVQQVPDLKVVLEPQTAPTKTKFNDFMIDILLEKPQAASSNNAVAQPILADTVAFVSSSKYITYKDSVLYWVITPKTTMEDLVVMRQEFAKRGLYFEITQFKTDPLQLFITAIGARGSRKPVSGSSAGFQYSTQTIHKPFSAKGGYISFGKRGFAGTCSIETLPPLLAKITIDDNKLAQNDWKKNKTKYIELFTSDELGPGVSTTYTKKSLQDLNSVGRTTSKINLGADSLLVIAEERRKDTILLNGLPSTLEAIEKIHIEQFYSAVFRFSWQKDPTQRKNYILIFTEDQ